MYKCFFIIFMLMLLPNQAAKAQEKRVEFSFGASLGLSASNVSSNSNGLSTKIDINADYYFSPNWSLMSGVGLWVDGLVMDEDLNGSDDDRGLFLSIPLIARYHFCLRNSNHQLVFGLGPALNFTLKRGEYNLNYDTTSPLFGREKLNKLGLSLQPSAMYRFNNVAFGIEGNIGLVNMQKRYGLTNGSLYFYNVWFKFCHHF